MNLGICYLFVGVTSVARPHELPAPFDGHRQYSHQVQTALTTTDGFGRALTPGSGKYDIKWFAVPSVWLITSVNAVRIESLYVALPTQRIYQTHLNYYLVTAEPHFICKTMDCMHRAKSMKRT